MSQLPKSKTVAIDPEATVAPRRFGAPLTLRASFLLTVLFDFSLVVLAVTIGALIWGI
jgi:hypothetical protein